MSANLTGHSICNHHPHLAFILPAYVRNLGFWVSLILEFSPPYTMPKRRATSPAGSVAGNSNTRTRRIKFDNFAAANDTDDLAPAHIAAAQQQERQTGSSGISTRPSPRGPATLPSLASLSARVFATNFKTLYIPEDHTNPKHGVAIRKTLKMLPDTIIAKLLALLREHCPTYLNHGLLVTVCIRISRCPNHYLNRRDI